MTVVSVAAGSDLVPDLARHATEGGHAEVVPAALLLAGGLSESVALPGHGRTHERWSALAALGAADLTVARVVEPHLDAVAILGEAGEKAPAGRTWGVWAAEGTTPRLTARPDAGAWLLDGRKPWCSLAGQLSHALVTAWVDQDRRGLFAVDLGQDGVEVEDASWEPNGLRAVTTTPVAFHAVRARPVGGPGWYLTRPGFAWGGIGVAAVWYGGAVAVAERLLAEAGRREPDQVGLMHLGDVDAALAGAAATLSQAADLVDAGHVAGEPAALLAHRVRAVVHDAAERVLHHAAHGLGPGPLSQEPEHARRVADLGLYLRQHHAERDAVAAGRLVLGEGGAW